MNDIITRIGKHGRPAKVCAYKITEDADYVVLERRKYHADNNNSYPSGRRGDKARRRDTERVQRLT